MNEKEILQDILIAQKFLLSMYKQMGMECSTPALRDLCIKHYAKTSEYNFATFTEMEKKGYYPVTDAGTKEINQAIKMHTQMQTDLDNRI